MMIGRMLGADGFASLVDVKLHLIQLLQQVIRKLDVCLVDLVDQQNDTLVGLERLPQLAAFDVVLDVMHTFVAQLAVA